MINPSHEAFNTFMESAAVKGRLLTAEEIDAAPVADFFAQYDWVIAVWPEGTKVGGLIVRDARRQEGYSRCNTIPCDSRETALKLFTVCRGPGNFAPEPSTH